MLLALAAGATFVARGFSGDIPHLTDLIYQGMSHRGIALIDVFQPCTRGGRTCPTSFTRRMIYKLDKEGHDPSSFEAAVKRAQETERWPIGVFYKTEKPIYTDEIPFIKDKPLVKHDISNVDIVKFVEEFM